MRAGLLLAAVLIHHFALWGLVTVNRGIPFADLLDHWDSAAYTTIATDGYRGALWAFFPLYPRLVGLLPGLPAVAGAVLSTAALGAFVLAVRKQASFWGLLLLLYAPASYVLHSHHTEGLFILLSLGALAGAQRGHAGVAAACSALVMWERLQGVLVAAAALALLWTHPRRAAVAVVLAASGVAFLTSRWAMTGDPIVFIHAQSSWTHASSPLDVARALWFGNPWQNTNWGSIARHAWFFVSLGLAIAFVRRHAVLGAYALVSLLLLLLQAEFVNAFRYTVVLFPLWFWAGKQLERTPVPARIAVVAGLVVLNHLTAHAYAIGQWAY